VLRIYARHHRAAYDGDDIRIHPIGHIYSRFNARKRAEMRAPSMFVEKQWYNQVVLFVLERVARYHERAMEFAHARRHNRTMERLTCVGGSVVYRTGIICPPAITRLNYSSRNKFAQTLHCFNRLPMIWRLPMLQTIAFSTFPFNIIWSLDSLIVDKYIISSRIALLFYRLIQFNSRIVTLIGQSYLCLFSNVNNIYSI